MSDSRLSQLQAMYEEDKSDSFLLYALAKEYESLGHLEESLKHYLLLRSEFPDYIGLYYHLGKLYEEFSELDKAMEIYDEGIALAKKIPDFHALSELMNVKTNLEMML